MTRTLSVLESHESYLRAKLSTERMRRSEAERRCRSTLDALLEVRREITEIERTAKDERRAA